jgi:copper chaperone CopZ
MSTTYAISGMTCQACVKRVQAALAPLADSVVVSLSPPQADVNGLRVSEIEFRNALAGTHYAFGNPAKENPIQFVRKPMESAASTNAPALTWFATYKPLLLVFAYILAASVFIQLSTGTISASQTMRYFMAGFFLTFSFFKMLDIAAFADAYAGYDLLAARWKPWGYIYPFVELALGLAYLLNWQPQWVNAITFVVMGFSTIGVIRAVMNKQKIRCACLGSVFALPMSTVTIVEDVAMVLMAGFSLL